MKQRPKVTPIRDPTLLEMEKLDTAAELTSQLKIERPYSCLELEFLSELQRSLPLAVRLTRKMSGSIMNRADSPVFCRSA